MRRKMKRRRQGQGQEQKQEQEKRTTTKKEEQQIGFEQSVVYNGIADPKDHGIHALNSVDWKSPLKESKYRTQRSPELLRTNDSSLRLAC